MDFETHTRTHTHQYIYYIYWISKKKKEAMNLKKSKEGYMGVVVERKVK